MCWIAIVVTVKHLRKEGYVINIKICCLHLSHTVKPDIICSTNRHKTLKIYVNVNQYVRRQQSSNITLKFNYELKFYNEVL